MRRVVTSGKLVPDVPDGSAPRDLPLVGKRPEGAHGLEGPEEKESEQA